MPPPIPRCSSWAYSSLVSPSHFSLPRYGSRVGLHIVLFEACSTFTRVAACTLALSPIRDTLIEGFSHFVTSMTAPIASGWSGCRVGLAPTGKRRLCTAHANSGLMHRSKQRLYSITSSARVRRQLNSTPSLRTVGAFARSPIIVANACSSASSPRASAGTSVNPSGPAASRVDFRRSRLGAKSSAARRLGAKPRKSAKADIGLAARTARG